MAAAANRVFPPGISWESEGSGLIERIRRITVEVLGPDGRRGAGVIWTGDGGIVTNAHVARGHVMVRFLDGRTAPAVLLARAPDRDLAALQVAATRLPCAERRDPRTLRPGEIVFAVGYPAGVPAAASLGILHSVAAGTWIEADIRLAPGNSGGPLADAAGRVVGVNAMVANGMGIAVSVAAIERFWRDAAARPPGGAS